MEIQCQMHVMVAMTILNSNTKHAVLTLRSGRGLAVLLDHQHLQRTYWMMHLHHHQRQSLIIFVHFLIQRPSFPSRGVDGLNDFNYLDDSSTVIQTHCFISCTRERAVSLL